MTREELVRQIFQKKSFLCVGLDVDLDKVPTHLLNEEDPIFTFNKQIIDATAPYCVAYKPNLAFYEAYGVKGLTAFEKTVKYIQENYPEQFIIADAKRGDIGNTSKMYAKTFFGEYKVDALTVAPYMGEDSVVPFLAYESEKKLLDEYLNIMNSFSKAEQKQLQINEFALSLFIRVVKSCAYFHRFTEFKKILESTINHYQFLFLFSKKYLNKKNHFLLKITQMKLYYFLWIILK